jgi:hypothetical protein
VHQLAGGRSLLELAASCATTKARCSVRLSKKPKHTCYVDDFERLGVDVGHY